jgi:hypothetical protein
VYPLVHWRGVVVEEPFHNESPRFLFVSRVVIIAQRVVTVQNYVARSAVLDH